MESLYLLIPAFIIIISVAPIFVTVRGSYNIFRNRGALGVFIFGFKVTSFIFALSGMSIKIYDDKGVREEDINFESKEAVITEKLISQIKHKTKLKEMSVYYNIGVGDAFETALLCGVINSALLIFFTRVKCSKPTASLLICDSVAYNKKVFESAVTLKISISLFDLVYSFINSVILTLKEKKKVN